MLESVLIADQRHASRSSAILLGYLRLPHTPFVKLSSGLALQPSVASLMLLSWIWYYVNLEKVAGVGQVFLLRAHGP